MVFFFNNTCLSKFILVSIKNYPGIAGIQVFFIVSKSYKKNLLLFFIILHLIFGSVFFQQKKCNQSILLYNIIKICLKKKKIYAFLFRFLYYLPLSSFVAHAIFKKIIYRVLYYKSTHYIRFNFFLFPPILELDRFYEDFDQFYVLVSLFKFQCNFKISNPVFFGANFVLQFFKFPCKILLF